MEIPANLIDNEEREHIYKRIFHDRVKILNGHLLATSIPATLLCASVLFVALYPITEGFMLVSWYIGMLIVSALRIFFYRLYKREPHQDKKNLNLFIIGSSIAALTWSIAGSVLMPTHDMYHLTITLIIIVGITAGGSQTLQASRVANMLFINLTIVPLILWMFFQNNYTHLVLGIAVLGYLIFMLELCERGYRQLVESIALHHVNEFLVNRLSGINDSLITEINERKKTQEQLDYLATHDVLTMIPNRLSFNLIFNQSLARAQRHSQELTILFIDVDHFKDINDNYGHDMGDEILYKIAHRLKDHLRSNDTIARIGGDEFIILLEDAAGREFIKRFTKRVNRLFCKPMKAKDHELLVTLSIGVSSYPYDGTNADILLKKADIALYHAKSQGRNRIEFYGEMMQST